MRFPIHLILDEIDWDPRKALPVGREIGVQAFGLRMFNNDRYPRVSAESHHWLEDLYDRGLCRFDVISPGFNKDAFDPATLDRLVEEELSLSLAHAKRLGVQQISLFSWAKPTDAALPSNPGELSSSMPFDDIVRAFRRMAEKAGRENLIISIEVGWQCWGDSGLGVARILREVDHPCLRMLWDPCNSLSGRTWWGRQYPDAPQVDDPMRLLLEELDQIADLIVGVHVRDEILKSPAWDYVRLGEGQVDWEILTHALWEHGYRGPLTIEHHIPAPDKESATRHAMQYLKKLMNNP